MAVWKETNARTAEVAKLQKQLEVTNARWQQFFTNYGELNDELLRVKLHHADGATVSDDLKSAAAARERPAKRTKLTQLCKETSTKLFIASFVALLTEMNGLKNWIETLMIEIHCIPALNVEARKLHENLADYENPDTAAKTTSKIRGRKRASALSN